MPWRLAPVFSVGKARTNVTAVYDWLVDYAGAERVLEQILALYPDARTTA